MVSKKSKRNVHIIPNEQFAELKNIERVTTYVYKRKKIKDELMDRITDALGRKLRKAKKTILVIDEIIWKATDRGFSFNGYETLIKKLGVSTSTISRAIGLLKESGEVVVCYRENPKSNGLKTPVVIFRNHANFDKIASILGLNEKVDEKVEKAEKLTATRDEALKTFATILGLPFNNKINSYVKGEIHPFEKIVKYIAIKVDEAQKRNNRGIKYLSAYVDRVLSDEMRRAKLEELKHKQQLNQQTVKPSPRAVFYDWLNEKPKPKSADLDALGVY